MHARIHVSIAKVEGLGVSSGSDTLMVPDCDAHELSARQLHRELDCHCVLPRVVLLLFFLSFLLVITFCSLTEIY